jgi:hypothetical protein
VRRVLLLRRIPPPRRPKLPCSVRTQPPFLRPDPVSRPQELREASGWSYTFGARVRRRVEGETRFRHAESCIEWHAESATSRHAETYLAAREIGKLHVGEFFADQLPGGGGAHIPKHGPQSGVKARPSSNRISPKLSIVGVERLSPVIVMGETAGQLDDTGRLGV